MNDTGATDSEIQKALYGRKKGSRIRVKEDPVDRTADGIVFHSAREMGHYLQFKTLLNAGTIAELERQIPYAVHVTTPNGHKVEIFKWLADFVVTERNGRKSIYDSKGMRTDTYRIKKKAVEAEYGIRIVEL